MIMVARAEIIEQTRQFGPFEVISLPLSDSLDSGAEFSAFSPEGKYSGMRDLSMELVG